jgi:osmotically inducible protein OsmC
MKIRKAQAVWEGTLKEGGGTVRFGDEAFESRYSWDDRFGEGKGTNPEELLAAARRLLLHGASSQLRAGSSPGSRPPPICISKLEAGWTVVKIVLDTEVSRGPKSAFRELAEKPRPPARSRALGRWT